VVRSPARFWFSSFGNAFGATSCVATSKTNPQFRPLGARAALHACDLRHRVGNVFPAARGNERSCERRTRRADRAPPSTKDVTPFKIKYRKRHSDDLKTSAGIHRGRSGKPSVTGAGRTPRQGQQRGSPTGATSTTGAGSRLASTPPTIPAQIEGSAFTHHVRSPHRNALPIISRTDGRIVVGFRNHRARSATTRYGGPGGRRVPCRLPSLQALALDRRWNGLGCKQDPRAWRAERRSLRRWVAQGAELGGLTHARASPAPGLIGGP